MRLFTSSTVKSKDNDIKVLRDNTNECLYKYLKKRY